MESTLPMKKCDMCCVSKNHARLYNISEVGPEKEDLSEYIDVFYRTLKIRKVSKSGDLLCFKCLKPFAQFLRKGNQLSASRSKIQQVKNSTRTALSKYRSNINLQRDSIAESSLKPIAGPSGTSSAGSSRSPITNSSSEPIAGPSGTSSAGSSRTPISDSSSEPIAGPSGASSAGSSRTPISDSSSEPIAGPSGTSSLGLSRSPIKDSSSKKMPGPSWALHSEPSLTRSFRETIVKPSTSSSLKRFSNTSDVVVNKKKRKIRNINNTCPFCHSHDVNNRDFQFDSTTKLCSRHTQPYTCLLKDCQIVFPNRDVFVPHYRSHLKLTRQTYLCRTCFAVLNCSRNVKRDVHIHQDISKLYCCCSDTFPSMADFVLHKLLKHSLDVTVIMSHGQMKEYSIGQIHPKNPLCDTTMTQNRRYKELFTCTIENCGSVFDTASTNVEHFKEHAQIPVSCSVCSICLLQSNIPDCHLNCNHINPKIACNYCKCGFDLLHDLAFHKVTNHLSVILCGPEKVKGCTVCGIEFRKDENPFDHYMTKCFSDENWDHKAFKIEKVEPSFDSVVKESSCVNSNFGGSFLCIDCGVHFYSLNMYLEHVKTHGQIYISRDIYKIMMCPICDKIYDRNDFVNHILNCTSGMQLTENTYGCACCQKILFTSEPWKFRVHYLFCKTFVKINDDGDKPWYKCLNCTFKSDNLSVCLGHGSGTCIYFKLKMRFSMSIDEVKKVEDRKKEILKYSQIDLKPQNDYKQFFNPKYCNKDRQKLLESFEYFCMFCKKGFYSDYIFGQHLNVHGYQCRPINILHCKFCSCDFDSMAHYTAHDPELVDAPIESTVHRPIKCEEIDDEISTTDVEISTRDVEISTANDEISPTDIEISTRDVEISTRDVEISTRDVEISTGDVEISTGDVEISTGDVEISTGDVEMSTRDDTITTAIQVFEQCGSTPTSSSPGTVYLDLLKDKEDYDPFNDLLIKDEIQEEMESYDENNVLLNDVTIEYDFEAIEEEVTIDEDQKPDLNSLNSDMN